MRSRTLFFCLYLVLLLSGCASTQPVSLVEVRAFADASASLGGYGELARRYRDTYEREQPYLPPGADRQARANDAKRKLVYNDFVSVQRAVVLYMQTLSALAGDARYDLSPRIAELGTGLQANTESGLTQRHISAYTGVTRLLTRLAASGYQNRSVATLVREGDADVQTLLEAMITLTRLYSKTYENEKKTVLGLFEIELPMAPRNTERLLMVLARVHFLNKSAEFKLLDKRYDLAMQGLSRVALGHQKLRDNLHQLTRDDIRLMLANYAGDLRQIHEGLVAN
ncbi:hypothetical protein [Massilia sp. S19_KUP03_FR1]|uniref:hypothetical protein n=1 Tax=Massilia sp. S19_KUP03_FR1 TaxID=3025503 RepID=UPI002FCDC21C